MPWFSLVLYPAKGGPYVRRFRAKNRDEAMGRYHATVDSREYRAVRLESDKGKQLAGCPPWGTVRTDGQGNLPLGGER